MNDKLERRKYKTPWWIKVCIFISGVAIALIIANVLTRM
jgi:hypothetical protein